MANGRLPTDDAGSRRTDPDPSARTVEQLQREVFMLRELFESKLAGYDKAITLLQANADKSPSISVVEEHVISLAHVMDEKFKGVDLRFAGVGLQFDERDVRQDQTSSKDQTALKDALTAAKELVNLQSTSSALAIAKSEASTAGQISQIVATFGETTKGLAEKMDATFKGLTDKIDTAVDGMKERLSTIERGGSSVEGRSAGRHDMWAWFIGGAGAAGALAALVTLIATRA